MKYFFLFILIISLQSCKPKKVYVDRLQIDTIKVDRIERIYMPQTQKIEIEKPCDSLGNLRPFYINSSNDKIKFKVISKDNIIRIETNIDSIKEITEKELRSKLTTSKEVIKERFIPKWVWYSLMFNILFIIIIILWIKRKVFLL